MLSDECVAFFFFLFRFSDRIAMPVETPVRGTKESKAKSLQYTLSNLSQYVSRNYRKSREDK